ncbi:MAG: hypothetical protein Q7S47_00125 [bacterium]|nr:hypothetical protein [bacterium]
MPREWIEFTHHTAAGAQLKRRALSAELVIMELPLGVTTFIRDHKIAHVIAGNHHYDVGLVNPDTVCAQDLVEHAQLATSLKRPVDPALLCLNPEQEEHAAERRFKLTLCDGSRREPSGSREEDASLRYHLEQWQGNRYRLLLCPGVNGEKSQSMLVMSNDKLAWILEVLDRKG